MRVPFPCLRPAHCSAASHSSSKFMHGNVKLFSRIQLSLFSEMRLKDLPCNGRLWALYVK